MHPAPQVIRWLLILLVSAQLAGKLYDASHLQEMLTLLGSSTPLAILLPALVAVDLLLLGLLLHPRSLRAGMVACGAVFAAIGVLLVTQDLHLPDAACRGLYLWNGTGSGPAALHRTAALSGIALLGSTWTPPAVSPPPESEKARA